MSGGEAKSGRDYDMLTLHRRHLIACGVPEPRASAVDQFPATRTDLREHYTAILDGTIEPPKWAKGINL